MQKDKLKKRYGLLSNVEDVTIIHAKDDSDKNISVKNFHFIFDVDSTLTTGKSTIQNKVRHAFRKMKESGFRIYLASGRNEAQLCQDMKDFNTESCGIAENDGILIGVGNDGHIIMGDRTYVFRLIEYHSDSNFKTHYTSGMNLELT